MMKGDSDKYTDRGDLAFLKKSWPKASSTEHKRSTKQYEIR